MPVEKIDYVRMLREVVIAQETFAIPECLPPHERRYLERLRNERRRFELGAVFRVNNTRPGSVRARMLWFLKAHPDEAFTCAELRYACECSVNTGESALRRLVRAGKVRRETYNTWTAV